MPTYTTRLGMTKPSGSASPEEEVDISLLNANADRLDESIGHILVNDGVTPADADLFDGAVVEEKTSGIIWRAKTDGAGGYTKVYIQYPYLGYFSRSATALTSGTTYQEKGFDTYNSAESKNASAADLVSNRWVAPIKAIYVIGIFVEFASNATGLRGLAYGKNGSVSTVRGFNGAWPASSIAATRIPSSLPILLNAGDTISAFVVQNSGGNLDIDLSLQASLQCPVQ